MTLAQISRHMYKLFALVLIAAVIYQFKDFKVSEFKWGDFYSLASIFIFSIILIISNKRKSKFNFKFSSSQSLALLFFGLAQLGLRVYEARHLSIWFDEWDQWQRSTQIPLFTASSYYFQPPINYMLDHFFTSAFGLSEFTLRCGSLFVSVMMAILLFGFLIQICSSVLIALLLSVLVLHQPWFYKYSIDARAVSIGLFGLMIFLTEIQFYLKLNELEVKQYKPREITALAFLFFMSLGLQPIFVVGSFLLVLLCFWPFGVFKKTQVFVITRAIFLALLFFLPVQLGIYLTSISQMTSVQSKWLKFEVDNWPEIQQVYGPYVILAVATLIVAILFNIKNKMTQNKVSFTATYFFTFWSLVFAVSILFLFGNIIQFRLAVSYLLFLLPLLIFCVANTYRGIMLSLKSQTMTRLISLILALTLVLLLPAFKLTWVQAFNKPSPRADYRSAYTYIFNNAGSQSYVMTLSFPKNLWSSIPLDVNVDLDFYYKIFKQTDEKQKPTNSPVFAEDDTIPLIDFYNQLKQKKDLNEIFILYHQDPEQVSFDLEVLQQSGVAEIEYFNYLAVIRLKKTKQNEELLALWFNFMNELAKQEALQYSWVYQLLQVQKALLTQNKLMLDSSYKLLKMILGNSENRISKAFDRFIRQEAEQINKNK